MIKELNGKNNKLFKTKIKNIPNWICQDKLTTCNSKI